MSREKSQLGEEQRLRVTEPIVDANGRCEHRTGLFTMIEDNLEPRFKPRYSAFELGRDAGSLRDPLGGSQDL